ncbi:MAG: KUP/HAK/KT family potassium transporter [Magnetococcales bacterium]|nr:KUP/HAK/KT family potassium transporter [Magnetococcales bacterium]
MNQPAHHETSGENRSLLPLMIGAIGIVFGDIGTSPLYAVKEALGGEHAPPPGFDSVVGIISLIIWTLLIILTLKYQLFIMKADHQGEGGNLVLVELARQLTYDKPNMQKFIMVAGMIGVAFFFGDGVITPAISVLSAVEGLETIAPSLKPLITPITLTILLLLFFFQSQGTTKIGRLFGPICILWFFSISIIGIKQIISYPKVLVALNPIHGLNYLLRNQSGNTLLVLGSVFLAVTGAEALYADMGHFGKPAINWSWGSFVFPALMLNYLGQGALILNDPLAVQNPFYLCVPHWALIPMVILATAATVIASQAVISGAFSATRQAMQLGYLPRLRIVHTSSTEFGQIYVPATNWLLLIAVVILVLGFKSSNNLAAAYGISVTVTMVAATPLAFGIVLRKMFSWSWSKAMILMIFFMAIDLGFLGANILKIADGGWFSLALGAVLFFLMSTWRKGQTLVREAVQKQEIPLDTFLHQFEAAPFNTMPGVAVFMTQNFKVAPSAFVELLRHTGSLYETIVFLSIRADALPYVNDDERVQVDILEGKFYRIIIRYGFMETMDVPRALVTCTLPDNRPLSLMDTWFFIGKAIFIAGRHPEMSQWRLQLFLDMFRSAESPTGFFKLPPSQVVDLGTRIVLGQE